MQEANIVGSKLDSWNKKTDQHAQVMKAYAIFLLPGQHKVWVQNANKKSETLSVIRSVLSANY